MLHTFKKQPRDLTDGPKRLARGLSALRDKATPIRSVQVVFWAEYNILSPNKMLCYAIYAPNLGSGNAILIQDRK